MEKDRRKIWGAVENKFRGIIWIPHINISVLLITIICTLSVALAQSNTFTSRPQQFTIFDEIGQMAAGMAHVHVAIPLNLTTFTDQADVLAEYLTKLSKVVEPGKPDKEPFMQGIRELAVFGLTRLNRMRKKILHLDIILPFDGDLTTARRNRATLETEDDDTLIEYDSFLEVHKSVIYNDLANTVHIDDLFVDNRALMQKHADRVQARIKEVIQLHFKHKKIQKHTNTKEVRVKRFTDNSEEDPNANWHFGNTTYINKTHFIDRHRRYYAGPRESLQGSMYKAVFHTADFGEERHAFEVESLKFLAKQCNATLFQIFEETKLLISTVDADTKRTHITKKEQVIDTRSGILKMLYQDLNKIEEDIKQDIDQYQHKRELTEQDTDQQRRRRTKRDDKVVKRERRLTKYDLTAAEKKIYLKMNEREDYHFVVQRTLLRIINEIRFQQRLQRKYDNFRKEADFAGNEVTKEFYTLDEIYRELPNSTLINKGKRVKRVAPLVVFGAVTGVLGTFLGMYNAYEVGVLKARLNEQGRNHNLLVHVTQKQEERIHRITENMNTISQIIKMMTEYNPALISAQIQAQLDLFESRLVRATGAVQQLQHRRLAIDLLDTTQMAEMHQTVAEVAASRGYELMPQRLSDYFQLEASYLRQGEDILIMLHVPCINKDQLLTIYKYIPFPYPLPMTVSQQNITVGESLAPDKSIGMPPLFNPAEVDVVDSLVIVPEAELIAIGRSNKYKILTQGDLDNCIKRNRVHLCERNQILHTDLANSCLGSIYNRDEKGVRDNCKLERKKLKETIYQLSATNHLLFTPVPYSTRIECKNGSHFPLYLAQTTQIHVPEECSVTLKSFHIQSDYNIRISPEPLHIPWQWDPLLLPADLLLDAALIDSKINSLHLNLAVLQNETSQKTDFDAMLNTRFYSPESFPWFIWVSVLASVFALLLLVMWYCYNVRQQRKYNEVPTNPGIQLINMPAAQAPANPDPPISPKHDALYPNVNENPPQYVHH
jgi:hypothetical protein